MSCTRMEPLDAFGQAWADAYQAALNSNEAYADAGADWEGPIALKLRAAPDHGIPEDRAVLLDLWHGQCREATALAAAAAEEQAEYVIEADRSTWRKVLDGDLDPLKGLMFGKLKLTKGKLRKLIPYTKASQQMVASAQDVPTDL